MWKKIKDWLSSGKDAKRDERQKIPEVGRLDAESSPWDVPVLDVRPVTQTMLSTTKDEQCAINAMSFRGDDGLSFIDVPPESPHAVETDLVYRTDGILAPGSLFSPGAMEEKWALFFHEGRILVVRSWTREVRLVAEVETAQDQVLVKRIIGAPDPSEEGPDLTVREFDFLMRSHVLGEVYPAPLPEGMEEDPSAAALWCMSSYGNRALFATPHEIARDVPEGILRSNSVLHIAVARGEASKVREFVAGGMSLGLLAQDEATPLQWSLVSQDESMPALLLKLGAPVDGRALDGSTLLMHAVERDSDAGLRFALSRGADPNAADHRGFTALHRAAEMGREEFVRLLLDHGAERAPEAQGYTPSALAQAREEKKIVEILNG